MKTIRTLLSLTLVFALLVSALPVMNTVRTAEAFTSQALNQRVRIIDTFTDPSGAPRSGKVTFILTQQVTSPAGLIAKGASVSAPLNAQGQFDLSVFPSRSLSPVAYYQVYVADANGGQTLIGLYDIPFSTSVINLSPYKVLDANLAAQYTFASSAAVTQLSNGISSAVYASMTNANVTTALGYTPLRPSLNLSDLMNPATARTNIGLGSVDDTSDATKNAAPAELTNKIITAPVINLATLNTATVNGATINSPVISTIVNAGTLTLPTSTDTLVGRATTDTLSNKTLNSPVINSPTVTGGMTVSGTLSAGGVDIAAATKALISKGILEYSPTYLSGFTNFYDVTKLNALNGATVASLPDLTGNGRHATQATAADRPTYYATEINTETPGAYLVANDASDYLSVPLPASATRTFFLTIRKQSPYSAGFALNHSPTTDVESRNLVSVIFNRWFAYKKLGGQGTDGVGYPSEWTVLAWRQNSATSVSFFVDGVLAETYTPENSDLASITSIKLGPFFGQMKQLAILGSAASDAEVAMHTAMLRGHNRWTWRYIGLEPLGGYAPITATQSRNFIVYKEGLTGDRPLILLNHQAAGDERTFLDNAGHFALVRALVEAGYIVAASSQYHTDFGGANSWGNQQALDANYALITWASANLNVDETKVGMLGMSMGGVATMNSFGDARIPGLKAAACYDCVLNLGYAYSSGAFASGLNVAYAITGASPHTYAEKTAGFDPMLRATASYAGKRFIFFKNSDDTIVDPTQHTGNFASYINGVATESTVTTTTGGHLAGLEASKTALLDFFKRAFQ